MDTSSNPSDPPDQPDRLQEQEPALPEVKLTKVSEFTLSLPLLPVKTKAISGTIGKAEVKGLAIEQWNDYTIVTVENGSEIQIFDKEGKKVEDFAPIGDTRLIFDWSALKEKLDKRYIIQKGAAFQPGDCRIEDLPELVQARATKLLGDKDHISFPEMKDEFPGLVRLAFSKILGGKYIIFFDKKDGQFIAYKTQNEQGATQPPRNWKRMESISLEDISTTEPELHNYIALLHAREDILQAKEDLKTEFKTLNDSCGAMIDSEKISIRKKGGGEFIDKITGINSNVCVDPKNPSIIYYCRTEKPFDLVRLDTSGDTQSWHTQTARFPKEYPQIDNLQLDPSGNFFLFYDKERVVFLEKNSLRELKSNVKISNIYFDSEGKIHGFENGQIVTYDTNLAEIGAEITAQNAQKLMAGIDVAGLFADEAKVGAAEEKDGGETYVHLVSIKEKYEGEFNKYIGAAKGTKDLDKIRSALQKLKVELKQKGNLAEAEIIFITKGIAHALELKQKEFASHDVGIIVEKVRARLDAGGMTLGLIGEIKADLNRAENLSGAVSDEIREAMREIAEKFAVQSRDFFITQGKAIEKDIDALAKRASDQLDAISTKRQFDDWFEFDYPHLIGNLGFFANNCPPECDETYRKIMEARTSLQRLADAFDKKFKAQYEAVREKAANRSEEMMQIIEQDTKDFVERLKQKHFPNRAEAEQFVAASESLKLLQSSIEALRQKNADAGRELELKLKVALSNALMEIERQSGVKSAPDGREMVMFGAMPFPKFEAHVQHKGIKKASLTFIPDEKTKGPGVSANAVLGDIGLHITTSRGKQETVRLWEGFIDENVWRYGMRSSKGKPIPESYVSQEVFRKIQTAYLDWSRGNSSKLRQHYEELKNLLHAHYAIRPDESDSTHESWKAEYLKLLNHYAEFCAENYIVLLRRIDQVKEAPETKYTNGKGFVPEWASHWVVAPEDEAKLEEMAEVLKMQLDNQEGLLNLVGHAGTGKDVLVKMFANRTRRPYFSFDCSKWTTEFELSEDIVLEAEGGASRTIKVPSVILTAIQTPGAIMYFNEINAMPEQAQIFLHSLLDEKRSLTLKTSSGRVIKAHPSVLFMSSMNPGYPGTFDPQMATRSRMVTLRVDYPPLHRKKTADDANPNPPYSASEALKIARSVDSLVESTLDPDMNRNEFVKMWDFYVNGLGENPHLTQTQKFDIETILALIQFANKLRDDFILKFEKSREARNALPVTQPITLREMRRCAYFISGMTPEQKATATSEEVARDLLNRFFISHIDKEEDREKIRTQMQTWTSAKRVAA